MASYNLVNGVRAHVTPLINEQLRGWTDEEVFVVSDAYAPGNRADPAQQGYLPDPDSAGLTCADLDFYRAGELCVRQLADLGHRDIALLGAPQVVYERDTGYAHRTRDGFLETARDLGCRAIARSCEEDAEAVQAGIKALLTRYPKIHVLAALRRRVPRQLSVVAISPTCWHSAPLPCSARSRSPPNSLAARRWIC